MINTSELSVNPPEGVTQKMNTMDDEIDLREMVSVLWKGKWYLLGAVFMFSVIAIGVALWLPNIYRSEGVYAMSKKESGISSLAGRLGGLAAMTGLSLGDSAGGDVEQAVALVQSWPFIDNMVNQYQLKPLILGVKGWDPSKQHVIWDDRRYNTEQHQWVGATFKDGASEPSSFEVYQAFNKKMMVKQDKKTGLLTISVEHYSPVVAAEWVSLVVKELNTHFQQRDMREAKNNIDYLERKAGETSIAGMQSVFYGMVESQMQTLMLAEVSDEYLIKKVVEPKVAETKYKPKRAIMVILSAFVAGVLSALAILVRYYWFVRHQKTALVQ